MNYVKAYLIEKWKCYTRKDLEIVKLGSTLNLYNN